MKDISMKKKDSTNKPAAVSPEKREDTEITVGLHISDSESTGLLVWILRTAICLCGITGSAMSFVSVIFPKEDFRPFLLTALIFCITATVASLMKKFGWMIIGAEYIAFAAIFFRLRETVVVGFLRTANVYLSLVRVKYKDMDYYDLSYFDGDMEQAVRLFLFAAVILISITVTASVIYRTSFACVFLVTFPPAELMLYYGLVPRYIWMGILICCWAGAAAAEFAEFPVSGPANVLPVYRKISSQSAAAAALIFLICFCGAAFFAELSGYERPDEFDDFKNSFSRYMKNFTFVKFVNDLKGLGSSGDKVSGATCQGKLGRQDTIDFTNETVMTVRLPKTAGSVYLKSFTGINYTGNSWLEENAEQKKKLDSTASRFTVESMTCDDQEGCFWRDYSRAIGGHSLPERDIRITKSNDNDKLEYIPYSKVPGQSGDAFSTKEYIVSVYELNYAAKLNAARMFLGMETEPDDISAKFAHDELLCRDLAYSQCLGLPDDFSAGAMIYGTSPREDTLSEAEWIRDWLDLNCDYDLSAGKLPFGEDFVDYFLLRTRRGSCTHFASTAALLCRYRGIPARYCEGYIIKPEDFPADAEYGEMTEVEVTDLRSHAWIEIYIDGMGWLPYEMTPGYGGTSQDEEEETSATTTVTETETTTETTAETDVTVSETVTEPAETSVTTSVPAAETDMTGVTDDTEIAPPTEKHPLNLTPIYVILIIGAVCGSVYLRYRIITTERKRIYDTGSANEKAVLACRVFMKICAYKGIHKESAESYEEFISRLGKEVPYLTEEQASAVINAGLSAEFGRGEISAEEAVTAVNVSEKFASRTYRGLNSAGRFVFRVVFCLH